MLREIDYELVEETKYRLYYVGNDGEIYVRRKNRTIKDLTKLAKVINARGTAIVRVAGCKNLNVKVQVAKSFLPRRYKNGDFVKCINGDPMDCRPENLEIIPRDEYFRKLQHDRVSRPVLVKKGDKWERYDTVKEAAENLHYDRSSLAKQLKGKKKAGDTEVKYGHRSPKRKKKKEAFQKNAETKA